MSFLIQPPIPERLNRCQLFGPGSRPELFEKMASSQADVINLDLEDSVAPPSKVEARQNISKAINDVAWADKTLSVRINGLDTEYWVDDVLSLVDNSSERLDCIMIPKVGNSSDIYAVDALVTALEKKNKRNKKLDFEIIIETAAGLENINEIALASERLVAMSFGVADYAASMGMQTTNIGGTQEGYHTISENGERLLMDPWHHPMVAMIAACRANGILPVDGPFGDISDQESYVAQAKRSATLGMAGKWAIHPSQVEIANKVFTPSEEAIENAKGIISEMESAEAKGAGAAVFKGKLIDIASIKQAKVLINQHNKIKNTS
ncbi:CoA ester lyase [Paracoccaceae bacterium]|nr:CoA ester lyase [Paracoccaceae bacterium]